ncbi:MAG TPA: Mth938-like domain-containing protein [Kiloniellales bacterium]|nr:Mth938-like domain-containing protein [Kiloniellales bacterium]
MDITPAVPADRQIVEGYGGGGFRISGVRYEGSVLVLPDRTLDWPVAAMADLTLESLAPLIEAASEIEILLLGCGQHTAPLPPEMHRALSAREVAVEPMDTGAACRTFDVLAAEGRQVAAALIAVA